MRIIFMGTSVFALPGLEALIKNHHVVGVYTQPPKPKGRGYQTQKSPVHDRAEQYGIPVFTPTSLRKKDVQDQIKNHQADVGVVAAYGLILPQGVLDSLPLGWLNIHGSLLPQWRGAAPIQRALMAGDDKTGVTIMKMDAGLDTGPIIIKEEILITPETDFISLQHALALLGARLLIDVLKTYPCPMTPQPSTHISYAHKLEKQEAFLNWHLPASVLINHMKGLHVWPGAYLTHKNQDIKILEAVLVLCDDQQTPGTVLDDQLLIQCGAHAIRPLVLQKPGKGPVELKSFLNGHSIPKGTILVQKHAAV